MPMGSEEESDVPFLPSPYVSTKVLARVMSSSDNSFNQETSTLHPSAKGGLLPLVSMDPNYNSIPGGSFNPTHTSVRRRC